MKHTIAADDYREKWKAQNEYSKFYSDVFGYPHAYIATIILLLLQYYAKTRTRIRTET